MQRGHWKPNALAQVLAFLTKIAHVLKQARRGRERVSVIRRFPSRN